MSMSGQPSATHKFKRGDHVRMYYYGKVLYGVVKHVRKFETTYDDVHVYFEALDRVMNCSEGALELITVLDRLANEA